MRTSYRLAAFALCLVAATPPRPATVHEAGDAGGDGLLVTPPVTTLAVAGGAGAVVPLRLHNGTAHDVTVELSAVEVRTGDDGSPELTSGADGPASWVSFAEERVTLQAATVTDLAPAVNVPDDAAPQGVFAIRAVAEDAPGVELHTIVALAPPAASAELEVDLDAARDDTHTVIVATLRNRGAAPAIASLRVTLTSWSGHRSVDHTASPLLVLPGAPRETRVSVATPVLPGPYTIAAVAVTQAGATIRADVRMVLWSTSSTLVAATLLVALTAALWWRVRGGVRRRSATDE